ncbi:MAG: hypothetical protein L0Y77_08925 [Chlorobi bacterium]|nr:hypothetical protein [Chlorobiota bacterium]
MKKFERFVSSNYFNTNERVYKLLRVLKKFHPSFSNRKLTNHYIFRKIYGDRKFNDITLRYLLSEFLKLTKQFISISATQKNKHEMSKIFIEEMIFRKQFSQVRSNIVKLEKEVNKNFIIGTNYLHNKMDVSLLWHMYSFFSSTGFKQIHKNVEGGEFEVYNTIIDLCHIYQNLIAIKNSHNVEYEDNLLFAFIRNFDYKGMLDSVEKLKTDDKQREKLLNVLKIYLCFMITFTDEKEEIYFEKMKALVFRFQDIFKTEELRDIHTMLTNCCRFKARAIDNEKYLRYSFELIQNALSKNLYLSLGQYMPFTTYILILNNALALKEINWTEDFVNKYIKEIAPEIREDVHSYSAAEILFQKKQFEGALEQLSKVKFDFEMIKPNVRSLTLMTYYELELIEAAYSLIDSFAHFINSNKKITPLQKEADSNFISFVKTLLKHKGKKVNLFKLVKEIERCSNLSRREWLLEKAEEVSELQARYFQNKGQRKRTSYRL